MVKKSVKLGLFIFVGLIIWQWLFRPEIQWLDNIGISVTAFLFHILFEWIGKRHERDKDKN